MAASNSFSSPHSQRAFQKGGADGHVFLREGDQLGNRAKRMADFQLQVPEDVQHRLG